MTLSSCSQDELLSSPDDERQICFGMSVGSDRPDWSDVSDRSRGERIVADTFNLEGNETFSDIPVLHCTAETKPIGGAPSRASAVTSGNEIKEIGVIAHASWYAPLLMNNDLYKRDKNGIYKSDDIRYWVDDANSTVDFYAFSPYKPDGLALPSTKGSTVLTYTAPQTASAQTELLLAVQKGIRGNYNQAVDLKFKHLLAGVKVRFSEIPAGWSIKSITFEGLHRSGSLDFASDTPEWTYTDEADNAVSATSPAEETLFMVLPQTSTSTLPITFTVIANDGTSDRTYTRQLPAARWAMGNITTYTISISDYQLDFLSKPTKQDAHYVVIPITIKSEGNIPGGSWTLSSNDAANVTIVEKSRLADGLQNLIDDGYWLDPYKGTGTLTSSTKGDVEIYVFLTENVTESDRHITRSLKPSGGNHEAKILSFYQYCPAWNNGIGVERIQDANYPWGFNWDANMKITYSMPSGFWAGIYHVLFEIFGNHDYITSTGSAWGGTWKVTVDFSKVPKLTTATSISDGNTNSWQIYNFDGVSEAQTIMSQLESWGGTADKQLPSNPTEFAVRACAMKNKYDVTTKTNQGQTIYNPVLNREDMVWYLPSHDEAPEMNDNLSGDYWTSTAITDPGTTAYKYTVGGSLSEQNRNDHLHVRAVRKKP